MELVMYYLFVGVIVAALNLLFVWRDSGTEEPGITTFLSWAILWPLVPITWLLVLLVGRYGW